MKHRTNHLVTLLVCFSFGLVNTGIMNSASAEQKNEKQEQKFGMNSIYGKVTEIINVPGYTYIEVDTGKEKAWAAGPTTSLNVGDMIAFSKGFPMENFHSKAMNRDFTVLYFVDGFVSDKGTPTNKIEDTNLLHSQIIKAPIKKEIKDINKVEGGNTIAEINSDKNNLKGKTIRLRGQVTKFTAKVMGKNWLHVRDSSTRDDLTVTTASTAAVDDILVIEGKLELDKDYGYGYVYPVILEDAKITKE